STGVERLFECLPHDREASRRLWSKAFGSSRRFSAWLARTSWGAKLQQNRRHHATHLLWRHGTIAALPRPVQGLSELACQMQVVPAADLDLATRSRLLAAHLIGCAMGFGAFALKERTIFGRGSALVDAHRDSIELAIALEPDQHAIAQLMASPQELRCAIPAI